MNGRTIYFAVLVCLMIGVLSPAPETQTLPEPAGHVNDFAGVLSRQTVERLENVLRILREKTGTEVAVVTVPDMGGLDENTYAVKLVEQWGIGSKEKNDGLLLLVAIKERRLRIEVGYGLEHIVTDASAGQIRDRYLRPYLGRNDYDSGITQGTLAIAALIAEETGADLGGTVPVAQRPPTGRRRTKAIAPLVNLFVIIIILLVLSGSRGGRGILAGMLIGSMLGGGRRRHYGGGFGGGFGGGGFGGGGFGGFGGGFSGGGGASGGF